MALTQAQLLADQARVFSDFPTVTITISGTDYAALILDQTRGNNYGDGGLVSLREFKVAIERSTMATIPTQGTLATYDSTSYRIAMVQIDDDGASVILNLEHTLTR